MTSRANLEPAYTESLNFLNYSVAVIAVTKADKYIDTFDTDYKPLGKSNERNWRACEEANPQISKTMLIPTQMTQRSTTARQWGSRW